MDDKLLFLLVLIFFYFLLLGFVNRDMKIIIEFIIILFFYNHQWISYRFVEFMYAIVGFLIAPVLTSFTTLLVKRQYVRPDFKIEIDGLQVINGIWEEVFWRNVIMVTFIDIMQSSKIMLLGIPAAIILASLCFVLSHRRKTLIDYMEMFIFTICLSLCALYIPFMNIGLHIGRNCYIVRLHKKQIDRVENG